MIAIDESPPKEQPMTKARQLNRRWRSRTLLAMGVIAATLVFAPVASAELAFGPVGSGAGQTSNPRAVAVDRSNGTVYVADSGNNRVDTFSATGEFIRAFGWGVADGTTAAFQTCTTTCFKGLAGTGAGQFVSGDLGSIAVDNDPLSPSFHDVFVGSSRVQRFSPSGSFILGFNTGTGGRTALGPGGTVHVADNANHVKKFSASGGLLAEFTLLPAGLGTNVNGIAVDSAGNFYVGGAGETGAVRKYDPSGVLLNTINPSFNIMDVAVDGDDNLYVSDAQNGYSPGNRAIIEFDATGTVLRVAYGDIARRFISLAPYANLAGDVFSVAENEAIVHIPFPPPGPVVAPNPLVGTATTRADPIGNLTATLNASINPENKATTYHFEYVDQEDFAAEGFSNPLETAETPVGSDFKLYPVSKGITGLAPDTTYHFRAVATSSDGTDVGAEATFTTLAPLEVLATWSTDVDTTSATLHAEVNPLGIAATGYFEYVDDAIYQVSGFADATEIPNVAGGSSPLDFGSSEDPQRRSATLFPLEPVTTYHYRIVVEDSFGTEMGPERTFSTLAPPGAPNDGCPNQVFRTGASAVLPDCRAYELVSPLDKNNGDIVADSNVSVTQAATNGRALSFASFRAFADPAAAPLTSQYLAFRDPATGWSTRSISTPRTTISLYPNGGQTNLQYKVFSPGDLCNGWLLQDSAVALTPGAFSDVPNLYRHDNCGQAGYELLSTTAPPGYTLEPVDSQYYPEIMGFSTDGTRSVFRANAKLTPNANIVKGVFQLYEAYDGGKLRLVSVLPNGSPATTHSTAGTALPPVVGTFREDSIHHAVSADGSRVFWSASSSANLNDPPSSGRLYVRLNATEAQSKISAGKCTEPEKACTIAISDTLGTYFRSAATDGSKAIYTVGEGLYEFDVGAETSQLIANGVKGVMGASDDASRIYFVSKEVLSGEGENSEGDKAGAGKPNLYLYEKGSGFVFIATLSSGETDAGGDGRSSSPVNNKPNVRSARVSPDGLHAAFTSTESLTGYDNIDANAGEPATEVYVFDATADGGAGMLVCASCKPSGARPVGRSLSQANGGVPRGWTAARIPGWVTQFQPTRALSDDGGRLFFNSYDALLPRDTNGKEDVYQWEAAGSGDCTEGSSAFSAPNGGCVSLISSGESPDDSVFFDATPSGSDVFFATQSSLLVQDYGLLDVYDARVNGGFPAPPKSPAACEGEACQGPLAPPNDPTPASSAYEGPGNTKTVAKAKKKARKRNHKKRHHAKKKHHKRAGHNGRTGR
jgi:hypothetical protein